MQEFDFHIEQRIAVLSESGSLTLELNRVSYGGNPAKLDLRRLRDGKPLKGVSMTDGEAERLLEALHGQE